MTREAINELKKYTLGKKNTEKVEISVLQLNRVIKALEQEPKIGHWIEEKDDYGDVICWHCDNCYEDSGFITTCKWDFCPNCGAKMIEPYEDKNKKCEDCTEWEYFEGYILV